jgi:hypothetical protein
MCADDVARTLDAQTQSASRVESAAAVAAGGQKAKAGENAQHTLSVL